MIEPERLWRYVRHTKLGEGPKNTPPITIYVDAASDVRDADYYARYKVHVDEHPNELKVGAAETLEKLGRRPADHSGFRREEDEPVDAWLARMLELGAVFITRDQLKTR